MYNASEQIAEFSKVNVAQAIRFAALSLENAEKFVTCNLTAAKAALAQGVEGAQAVATVKDVQDLVVLRTKIAEAQVQQAVGYSRDIYDIAAEAQAEYSAFAEEAFAMYTKGVTAWVDRASKSAPAGSDVAVNAVRSTIAATTAVFDQFQKASKQVVNLADANVRAVAAKASNAKGRKAA